MQFEESNLSKMLQCMLDSCVFSGGPVVVFPVSLQKSSAFGKKKKIFFLLFFDIFSLVFTQKRFYWCGGKYKLPLTAWQKRIQLCTQQFPESNLFLIVLFFSVYEAMPVLVC